MLVKGTMKISNMIMMRFKEISLLINITSTQKIYKKTNPSSLKTKNELINK
jgi:hypothetical protein